MPSEVCFIEELAVSTKDFNLYYTVCINKQRSLRIDASELSTNWNIKTTIDGSKKYFFLENQKSDWSLTKKICRIETYSLALTFEPQTTEDTMVCFVSDVEAEKLRNQGYEVYQTTLKVKNKRVTIFYVITNK